MIVEIDRDMEEYFFEKKFLNYIGDFINVDIFCLKDKLDIRGEIVYKLGVFLKWM